MLLRTITAFTPPNPKEFIIAILISEMVEGRLYKKYRIYEKAIAL